MDNKKRIVVFISGRGSNLKSLIAHQEAYTIVAVISNNPDAAGLGYAREHGIETVAYAREENQPLAEYKERLYAAARMRCPDFIVLAGFMQIVAAPFIREYQNRIINIHPSLLPAFPGLDTHARALEARVQEHGCTVHIVDEGVDTGPIIAQASVAVASDDTVTSLSQRVLAREHEMYPLVLHALCTGAVWCKERTICYSQEFIATAAARGLMIKGT
jgi:phosphoribosylglycinamide formyltransferase-1